mmetsp:Transcript_43864/g.103027  ORF Transcript_43864/g.103027 Transcript_43864/m.103027 type:complete len:283 (+) Transcript_43864:1000-1848(+)
MCAIVIDSIAELEADDLLEGVLHEAVIEAAVESIAESTADSNGRWLTRGTHARSRADGPLRLPHLATDPEAAFVDAASQGVLLERLLFDGLAHKIAMAGENLLLRDALALTADEMLAELLMHTTLAVGQRREEAAALRPIGAAHARLTAQLLVEVMAEGLARMPLEALLPSPPRAPAATRRLRGSTPATGGGARSQQASEPASTQRTRETTTTSRASASESRRSSGSGSDSGSRSVSGSGSGSDSGSGSASESESQSGSASDSRSDSATSASQSPQPINQGN